MTENTNFIKTSSSDELDIHLLVIYLWCNKFKIILITLAVTILGIVYALTAPEVYLSEATIAPIESQKEDGTSSILSKFSGLGGLVGTQLGTGSAFRPLLAEKGSYKPF